MRWLIFAALLLAGGARDYGVAGTRPWSDFFNQPRDAAIPKDVRVFVIKAQGCGHFSGEEGYDAERAAYLKATMDELCPGLEARRKHLLAKYAARPAVRAIIAEVTEGFSFE